MMKEIGGYIELEHFRLPMFHGPVSRFSTK